MGAKQYPPERQDKPYQHAEPPTGDGRESLDAGHEKNIGAERRAQNREIHGRARGPGIEYDLNPVRTVVVVDHVQNTAVNRVRVDRIAEAREPERERLICRSSEGFKSVGGRTRRDDRAIGRRGRKIKARARLGGW